MMKRLNFAICLVILLWCSQVTFAEDFQAKVVQVATGDTLTILTQDNEQKIILLHGIECPQENQAYGKEAKQFTKDLVAGKRVTVHTFGEDRAGRTRGDVLLADGRNLSEVLLQAGMAWWFYKDSDDEQLGVLEVKAKIAKVGLWTIPNPIPPWIFRHLGKLANPSAQTPPKSLP